MDITSVSFVCSFVQIKSIEAFAMNICEHFLSSFNHVTRAHVYVEEVPWKRLEKVPSHMFPVYWKKLLWWFVLECDWEPLCPPFQNGVKHVHAFIHTPTGTHFCEVEQMRNGKEPVSVVLLCKRHQASFVDGFASLAHSNSLYWHRGKW